MQMGYLGAKNMKLHLKDAYANVICGALAAFFAQSVFVEQVLRHAILRGTHAAQICHPVGQLFDGLHLLVQEVCLDEIIQLSERKNWN